MPEWLLHNGRICPVAGIGTFMLAPAEAQNSVRETLKDQRQARNPVRMASLRAAVFRFDLL